MLFEILYHFPERAFPLRIYTPPGYLKFIPPGGILTPSWRASVKKETRDNVDRRLARIEGQVKALRRMVGEDRYCIDIAQQVQAARAALSSLESIILDDHISTCVQHALEGDNLGEREAKIEELIKVMRGKK
jgi:DNA-binding FrmR family transcriptional regulator